MGTETRPILHLRGVSDSFSAAFSLKEMFSAVNSVLHYQQLWVICWKFSSAKQYEVLKMDDPNPGIYFDDLSKVCVLEPEIAQQTQELKSECKEFVDKIADFQKIVSGFINVVDTLAKEVEKEKMKAIGQMNLLKSMAKQRESQQLQLRALIAEKQTQLERFRLQHAALLKQESEQNEFIEQFMIQK